MSLNELNNSQILILYFYNAELLEDFQKIFLNKTIEKSIDLPEIGKISLYSDFDNETLEEIKNSEYYKEIISINEKLKPIALMIEESNPKLYKDIQESFINSLV